jgi:hypothetical protein
MSTRNHDRGPDGAGISLSTTKALNEAIKKEALRQGRTISNYIANTIAVSLGLPPEAVISPNKRRPRTSKPALRELPHKSSKPLPEKMSQADIKAGITPAQAAKLAECARIGREERLAREAGRDLKQA